MLKSSVRLVLRASSTTIATLEPVVGRRGEIDPWQQISDMRDAITYTAGRAEVDTDRIGIWGTSYSGGHCLVVAATDRRVKCVVSVVPTLVVTRTLSGHSRRTAMRPLFAR